ncbi:MAG: integrase [Chryseobacterium sp.]|nr:integrase [Chryseobacterium sp.]
MIISFHTSPKIANNKDVNIIFSLSKNPGDVALSIQTPLFINANEWDPEKQRPKNIYNKKNKHLNYSLNAIKIRSTEIINNNDGKIRGLNKTLAFEIDKICGLKAVQYPSDSLLYFILLYTNQKEQLIQLSTYRRYMVFKNLFENFEGFIAKRITIKEVDGELITRFYSFAKTEQYNDSTILRSIHFLKTILRFAEKNGLQTQINRLDLARIKISRKIITLSEEELLKIKSTIVPQELQPAKDWLLISCYTGQRFSDFIKFDKSHLIDINGRTCISFIQQKTRKKVTLPLHQTVLNIIKRNNYSFPKPIDITMYNNAIKKVARLADINDIVEVRKRAGYRSTDEKTEKWKVVSSHIGRRSFSSNFYGRIPTSLLIQATGHSSEQMFLNYVNPVNNEIIAALGNYFDKMYDERVRRSI